MPLSSWPSSRAPYASYDEGGYGYDPEVHPHGWDRTAFARRAGRAEKERTGGLEILAPRSYAPKPPLTVGECAELERLAYLAGPAAPAQMAEAA